MPLKPISEVTALVFDYGNSVSLAQRLSRDCKKVYYATNWQTGFPKWNQYSVGIGVPGIERVDHWAEVFTECDMVVIPDLYQGALADLMVSLGKPVFGARTGENLEIYREDFKEFLAAAGLPVNKHEVLYGFSALETYLNMNEEKWVKTSIIRGNGETFFWHNKKLSASRLDSLRHDLGSFKNEAVFVVEEPIPDAVEIGYDGFCIDGKFPSIALTGVEVKDCGYLGGVIPYSSLPPVLKQINKALEGPFAGTGYKCFFSNEVRWTGKQGYFIDTTCFSSDTEVLTDKGWKFFYDLDGTEKVCTLNPENRQIEYNVPYNNVSYYHEGDMVCISNKLKTIECIVTPNHSVWRTDRHNKKIFSQRADELTDKGYIPRTGVWNEKDIEWFELPEYKKEWEFNSSRCGGYTICKKVKHDAALKIKMDDWIAFMAWYLSEGSCSKHGVSISQKKNISEVKCVLDKLGFKYSYSNNNFSISSVQLRAYCKQFGICNEKYIPDYIKNASKRQIQIFLDNYRLGDGATERLRYFTTSVKMADDLQELSLKAGRVANISIKKVKGTRQKGLKGNYIRNHDSIIITENKETNYWFETTARKNNYISKIPYKGMVYDVTVKNHILYVRRKGKPFWSGNCRMPQPPGDLQMELYENFSEAVWQMANGIVPELKPIAKYGAQIIIKSSWATEEPQAVYFPKEYEDRVRVKNLMYKERIPYYIPCDIEMEEIGSVCGYGDTVADAIKDASKIAETVEGDCVHCDGGPLEKAFEQIKKLKTFGIDLFGNK